MPLKQTCRVARPAALIDEIHAAQLTIGSLGCLPMASPGLAAAWGLRPGAKVSRR